MSKGWSFGGATMRRLVEREVAGDGRSFAEDRIDAHAASVQLDKGLHQRQTKPGAAVPRSVGMALEPVEHLVLDVGRNAGAPIGHGKDHMMVGAPGAQRNRGILWRKSD